MQVYLQFGSYYYYSISFTTLHMAHIRKSLTLRLETLSGFILVITVCSTTFISRILTGGTVVGSVDCISYMKHQSLMTSGMNKTHKQSQLTQKLVEEQQQNEQQSQVQSQPSHFQKFKEYCCKNIQMSQRTITLEGSVEPQNYHNNIVKNTKYNVFTFIPKVLYNQFKFFYNLFFLITALTQLIEILRVGLFITYIGPLMLVLSLTMAKQAYDDFNTYKRDIEANSKEYEVLRPHGMQKIKSKDLLVGDIVKVQGGDRIPADMVTLYSDNEQGTLFLKTDQLDGQTDWKLRKAVKMTQAIVKSQDDYSKLLDSKYSCQVKAPSGQIYAFGGLFTNNEEDLAEKLTLQNTLWTTTVLTNGTALGLVVYVGRQTRINMGGSDARTKFGILDNEVNTLSKTLFLILVLLTSGFILLQRVQFKYVPIQFMRMLILLSSIIPISMRVNLDFAKLFYSYLINNDKYIPGAVTRNSTIPEQLGRVKYVLSDKTGTLTQNEMIFKQISIDDQTKFLEDQPQEISSTLEDYEEINEKIESKEKNLKLIMNALALCHNVTPVFSEDRQKKQYQASSPDQITFVKMAQKYGLQILERTQTTMTLKIPSGKTVEYEIKYSFPFKSQTKRMGIILEDKKTNEIVFYLKGADATMKQFITSRQKKAFIQEECKDLSMSGLRTLVMARKVLSADFYKKWSQQYQKAYNKLEIDQKQIQKLMHELEHGVTFLGITGIQDKLQNNLKSTIESLRSGGIKIWMITGDKMQTAECIGRSCGLQKTTQANYKIYQIDTEQKWAEHWSNVKNNLDQVLIIDGKTLTYVLENKEISKDFFKTAMKMPAVICCRCSPSQKKTLTAGVKDRKMKKEAVLGIGDGGNDVGMIQAADVGVGIVGKQGKQAALAADFSINEFRDLKTLLFWHGRLSYHRSALLSAFIMHRGFIISVFQIIFSCVFYYVSIPVFNSYLQLGYATIFTFWPVFSLILDRDIDFENALRFPKLYYSLQSVEYLSVANFMIWLWKATYQATIIMILTLVFFQDNSYMELQTVAFTILMLTEYFMTFSQINRYHYYLIITVFGSLLTYIICLFFFNEYLHVSELSLTDILYILGFFAISWLPFMLWKIFRKKVWPTDVEKVRKNTKERAVGRGIHDRESIRGGESYLASL